MRHHPPALGALFVALACSLFGCDGGRTPAPPPPAPTVTTPPPAPRPPAPPPAPSATATTPAPEPAPAGAAMAGAWTSPSCGGRSYERWLTLHEGGKASGEDRVSPCPPNTRCVWSGIVPFEGEWREASGGVTLSLTAKGGGGKVSLPTSLRWDADAGTLIEVQQDQRCAYTRR